MNETSFPSVRQMMTESPHGERAGDDAGGVSLVGLVLTVAALVALVVTVTLALRTIDSAEVGSGQVLGDVTVRDH